MKTAFAAIALSVALIGCSSDSTPIDESSAGNQPEAAPDASDSTDNKAPRIVDSQVELQKPKVVKLASGLNADAKPKGLLGVGPDVMITMLQSQIRLQRELNGGTNPTFAEFSQSVKQANIQLTVMPAWQMIGYDETTGELCLLEDKGEKIRRYKAKGIPLDEDDKPFDTPETSN